MKPNSATTKARPQLAPFWDDSGGSMTILAVVFFVVLMAVGGLTIDIQRLYGVHGQMQNYVDDVALATATELDGQSNALTRALRAACGTACGQAAGPLVSGPANSASFATVTTLTIQKVSFLSRISADPGPLAVTPTQEEINNGWLLCTFEGGAWTPANCNNVNNEKVAKFVDVAASPRTVNYFVLPVADVILGIFGAAPISSQATLQLRATAGFKAAVCDLTPLMVCNPSEPVGNTNTLYPYTPTVGQQIVMKESGSNSQWAPGDFGLLDVPSDAGGTLCNGGGANAVRCMLGLVDPLTQCISNDQIDVKPGQSQSTNQGLNVRFDIYEGNMNGNKNNANFAPSINVAKGICRISGSNCNYNGGNACSNLNQMAATPASPANKHTIRLPRDANIQTDGDNGNVRFGNGTWAKDASCAAAATPQECYWSINHTGTLPASLATATRYQMYRYEIDNNLIPNKSPTNGENGNKVCSSASGINNPNRDRRILTMAVTNCQAYGLNGNASGIKAVGYVQMFLTEPVGLDAAGAPTSGNNIYGEIVGVVKPNDSSGVYHLQPVLYR